jgi:hypothetical protein
VIATVFFGATASQIVPAMRIKVVGLVHTISINASDHRRRTAWLLRRAASEPVNFCPKWRFARGMLRQICHRSPLRCQSGVEVLEIWRLFAILREIGIGGWGAA